MGILEAQQTRPGEMMIVWFDDLFHVLEIQRPIRMCPHSLWLDAAKHSRSAAFVLECVCVFSGDVLVAATAGRQTQRSSFRPVASVVPREYP
jgi:hypothetical protein